MNKGVLFLFSLVVLSGFVSALPLEQQLENFFNGAEPVIRYILGDVSGIGNFDSGEVLFAKLLVFMILTAVVYLAVRQVPRLGENNKMAVFLAVLISLLSVRYITEESLLNFVWLPYGVLGITLTSILPLIIAFFFLKSFDSKFIRRTGWALFGVVFAFLAYTRWDELASSSTFNAAWIYFFVAVISAIMYYWGEDVYVNIDMAEINQIHDERKQIEATRISSEVDSLIAQLAAGAGNEKQQQVIRNQIRKKKKLIRTLMRA